MTDPLHQHVIDLKTEIREARGDIAAIKGEVMRQGGMIGPVFTKLDLALRPVKRPRLESAAVIAAAVALCIIAFAAVAIASR